MRQSKKEKSMSVRAAGKAKRVEARADAEALMERKLYKKGWDFVKETGAWINDATGAVAKSVYEACAMQKAKEREGKTTVEQVQEHLTKSGWQLCGPLMNVWKLPNTLSKTWKGKPASPDIILSLKKAYKYQLKLDAVPHD